MKFCKNVSKIKNLRNIASVHDSSSVIKAVRNAVLLVNGEGTTSIMEAKGSKLWWQNHHPLLGPYLRQSTV